MIKEVIIRKMGYFKCGACGMLYNSKAFAKKCEAWCRKHKSCNLKITKHAINKNEKGGEK